MARWGELLARTVHRLESGVDEFRYRLSDRFGTGEVAPVPYLSYGTRERLLVMGRVLRVRPIAPARDDASMWSNLRDAYRRFESDEAPFAELTLRIGRTERRVVADDEGYFRSWIALPEPLPVVHAPIQRVEVVLRRLGGGGGAAAPVAAPVYASVLVPSAAEVGVISDVDDTVLQSDATELLTMARNVLFENARTRLPFAGVAALYRALQRDVNPIFYVSSSPWNLYDLLAEFLDANDIPSGPLLLRDWGIGPGELLPTAHRGHKLEAIEEIVATYPELPFGLIGDSGQEDPEIYAETARLHPGRIAWIALRDVGTDAQRRAEIAKLSAELAALGVPLALVSDSVGVARLAAGQGWLAERDIARIGRAVAAGA